MCGRQVDLGFLVLNAQPQLSSRMASLPGELDCHVLTPLVHPRDTGQGTSYHRDVVPRSKDTAAEDGNFFELEAGSEPPESHE